MFAYAHKLPDNSRIEKIHPATIPPDEDPTPEGSFGNLFPKDILQRLSLSSWDFWNLSNSSQFFKHNLQKQSIITPAYKKRLRQLLRLKVIQTTTPLSEAQKIDMQYIETLLETYNDYFSTLKKSYKQSRNNNYKHSIDNKELDKIFEQIETIKLILPSSLIQGTAIGILQATANFLNGYIKAITNKNINWEELDALAIKDIGSAQRDAGERVWVRYFRHKNMKDRSSLYDRNFSCSSFLDSDLGENFFIFVDKYSTGFSCDDKCRVPPYEIYPNDVVIEEYVRPPDFYPSILPKNSLSLIDVVTTHINTYKTNCKIGPTQNKVIEKKYLERLLSNRNSIPKGSFFAAFPQYIPKRFPPSSREVWDTCREPRFFKNKHQKLRAIDISHQDYLHKLLRLENPPKPSSSTEIQETDIQYIKTLLIAYENYFLLYKNIHQIFPNFFVWPDNEMFRKAFDENFNQIEYFKQTIPKKLFFGTSIGILQATFKFLRAHQEMAIRTVINWKKLDKLAIQKLGSAQRLAGKKILDCYFKGEAMKENSSYDTMYAEFIKNTKCFGPLIEDHLGYNYYIACIPDDSKMPNVPLPLDSAFASFITHLNNHHACNIVLDGLSLIDVILERLNMEIEMISAPQKLTRRHTI